MSFTIQYRPLIFVTVQDGSSSKPLPVFSFVVGSRTRRLMQDHQLHFRSSSAGFAIYYCQNPEAPDPLLGRITSRVRLSFLISLATPDFFDRYEPTLTPESGPQLYLDNLTSGGSIQTAAGSTLSAGDLVQVEDAMQLVPRVFSKAADVSGASPPTKFVVRKKFNPGVVVLEARIMAAAGSSYGTGTIDLSGEPEGPYILETDPSSGSPRTIYADDHLVRQPTLGLVDLYWETAQTTAPAEGVEYVVGFQKR
jgi:hypothetical protein